MADEGKEKGGVKYSAIDAGADAATSAFNDAAKSAAGTMAKSVMKDQLAKRKEDAVKLKKWIKDGTREKEKERERESPWWPGELGTYSHNSVRSPPPPPLPTHSAARPLFRAEGAVCVLLPLVGSLWNVYGPHGIRDRPHL